MLQINRDNPDAYARVKGGEEFENLRGTVSFYSVYGGTIVIVELYGLPEELEKNTGGFLGFHIHEGKACTGNQTDSFADAGNHLNPEGRPHPEHEGDLPALMINDGVVWMAVYTGRFFPEDVVGRTVIVHDMPDDFRTQPSGGSGKKIACGEIIAWESEYH